MKLLIVAQVLDENHPILGFFHEWVACFAKEAQSVIVVALEVGQYHLPPHVQVYSLGKEAGAGRGTFMWRFFTIVGRLILSRQIDHVFYHMGAIFTVLGAPFFLVRRFFGVKFFWWKAHGTINAMGRLAGYFVDTIVTSTASGYQYHIGKRKIVGQAIDTKHFCLPLIANRTPTVLYVGRISPVKQLEVFIETVRQLAPLGYRGLIVGPGDDTRYAHNLRTLPGAEFCDYLGPKTHTQLPALYQSATFFVNPSLTGSMDKTVLEAALCGCLPLTANVAFVDLLQAHGLFIEEGTAQAYSSRLQSLIANPTPDLAGAVAATVAANHSLDTFFKRIFV